MAERGEARPHVPAPGLHVIVGAGPIGQGIAEVLASAGRNVRVVTRSGEATGLPAAVSTVQADAADAVELTRACKDAAVIYFVAAPPAQHWAEVLPAMHEGAIRAAAATGAVLVTAEDLYGYGGGARSLTEAQHLEPNAREGQTRARLSTRLLEAHRAGEIRAVAGRTSVIFGPGVRRSQLGEQIWPKLLKEKAVWWLGDPDVTHTFTFAPDVSRSLVRLGSEPAAWGRGWHLPSPPDLTVRHLLSLAASIANVGGPTLHKVPKPARLLISFVASGITEPPEAAYQFDAPFVMDWSDYRSTFHEEATPWEDALRATLDWWSAAAAAE